MDSSAEQKTLFIRRQAMMWSATMHNYQISVLKECICFSTHRTWANPIIATGNCIAIKRKLTHHNIVHHSYSFTSQYIGNRSLRLVCTMKLHFSHFYFVFPQDKSLILEPHFLKVSHRT
jgi:hypothetical protein